MSHDRLYLEHILDCLQRIEEYTCGGREAFFHSRLIQDAVVRNLQILAESSKRLSPELQQASPEIPWQQIAGFRNVVVHEYLRLDLAFVWEIVTEDLPALKGAIRRLHDALPGLR